MTRNEIRRQAAHILKHGMWINGMAPMAADDVGKLADLLVDHLERDGLLAGGESEEPVWEREWEDSDGDYLVVGVPEGKEAVSFITWGSVWLSADVVTSEVIPWLARSVIEVRKRAR